MSKKWSRRALFEGFPWFSAVGASSDGFFAVSDGYVQKRVARPGGDALAWGKRWVGSVKIPSASMAPAVCSRDLQLSRSGGG